MPEMKYPQRVSGKERSRPTARRNLASFTYGTNSAPISIVFCLQSVTNYRWYRTNKSLTLRTLGKYFKNIYIAQTTDGDPYSWNLPPSSQKRQKTPRQLYTSVHILLFSLTVYFTPSHFFANNISGLSPARSLSSDYYTYTWVFFYDNNLEPNTVTL